MLRLTFALTTLALIGTLHCTFQESDLNESLEDSTGDDTNGSNGNEEVLLPSPLARYRINNTSLGQVSSLIDDSPNPLHVPMVNNSDTSPILRFAEGIGIYLDYTEEYNSDNGGGRQEISLSLIHI